MARAEKRRRERKSSIRSTKFRSVPARLKRMRYGVRHVETVRFYGQYISRVGKRKRLSYGVEVDPRMSNKEIGEQIRIVCNSMKYDKMLPRHRSGDIFPSFHELLYETQWFKVRRIEKYKPGVKYER